jgi:hypothetical protein
VGWESDFTCEGVLSLTDFSALVNEVEAFDPVARAIRFSAKDPAAVLEYYRTFDIVQFARRLDGLLDLLDVTADALPDPMLWKELLESRLGRYPATRKTSRCRPTLLRGPA